jgi:serine/threonine-protein kinase PknG
MSVLDPQRRLAAMAASLKVLSAASAELPLRMADLEIELSSFAEAEAHIAAVEKSDPYNWRVAWYRGKLLLAQGTKDDVQRGLRQFDVVLGELPGELAPKLAIGLGYEMAEDPKNAIVYYDSVIRTDPLCTSAAFGLARANLLEGDRAGAIAALERVSSASVRFVQAQLAMANVLSGDAHQPPSVDELKHAARVIDGLQGLVDGLPAHRIAADFFRVAAEVFERDPPKNGSGSDEHLLGVEPSVAGLRAAAERELRLCARYVADRSARIAYVDQANRVRPRTLW